MWFWYSILSALLGAVVFVLNKKALHNISAIVVSWSLFALSVPFLLIFLIIRHSIPSLNGLFFFGMFGSVTFFAFSKVMSLQSLKSSLVSKIVPLSALSVFFSYLLALIFLKEQLHLVPLIGIAAIMIGCYMINVQTAKEDIWKPFKLLVSEKSSLIYIIAMFLASASGVMDKTALLNSSPSDPVFLLCVENFLMSLLIMTYLPRVEPAWVREVKKNFPILFISSSLYMGVTFFVFLGFNNGPVALVSGVKNIQILFSLALGYFFLKDYSSKHVWFGTILMIVGVLLVKL